MTELTVRNVHLPNMMTENHALIVIKFTVNFVMFVIKKLVLNVKVRSLSLMEFVNVMNLVISIQLIINVILVLNLKILKIVFNALMMRNSVSFVKSHIQKKI